jgi:hypothetical protein
MDIQLESVIRLLAELTPMLLALSTLLEKIEALDGQTRINRDEIRVNTELLQALADDIRGVVCDRPDQEAAGKDSLP